jgi:predicted  nucleic acid-binding Zn-ribbon protein
MKRLTTDIRKTCSKCHKAKPINMFYFREQALDGLTSWCKECTRNNAKISKETSKKTFAYLEKKCQEQEKEIEKLKKKIAVLENEGQEKIKHIKQEIVSLTDKLLV